MNGKSAVKRAGQPLLIKDCLAFLPGRGFTPRTGVLVENGRLAAIGPDLKAPPGAAVHDAAGAHLTPGLVDGHTHLALADPPQLDLPDVNEKTEPVTPYLRVSDAINPFSPSLALALRNGITTAMITPGSANVFCGLTAIMKTGGGDLDRMLIQDPAGMKMALGQNPKNAYFAGRNQAPATRMGIAHLVRKTFREAREYGEKRGKIRGERRPAYDQGLENVLLLLAGKLPARVHCHRADDIMTALRLAREFSFPLCLDHASEAWLVTEAIAAAGVPCFLGPNYGVPRKDENSRKGFATAARVHQAGIRFAIITDHDVEPAWFLPVAAGLAVREGLESDAGLLAITSWPAEIMGIADRVGTLAPGLDADLVLWDRHPLQLAKPLTVFLEGEPVAAAGEPPPVPPTRFI